MEKKNNLINIFKYAVLLLFILWIGFLYYLIYFNIEGTFLYKNKEIISIASIFLYSLIHLIILLLIKKYDLSLKVESLITTSAFFFTVLSDLCLLNYFKDYETGLIFFIIVQILYFIRITISNYNLIKLTLSVILRIIVIIIINIILDKIDYSNTLYIRVSIYITNLVINMVEEIYNSIYFIVKKDNNRILAHAINTIGLILFILCDVSVGLYNVYNIMGDYMWRFYLPSQLLILISSLCLYNIHLFKEGVLNVKENN